MKFSALAPVFLLSLGTLTACGGGSETSPDPTPTPDTTAPVITLNGDSALTHSAGSVYADAGATANDATDGSVDVTMTGAVDSDVVSSYTLTYSASDKAGNNSSTTRTVNVIDDVAPILEVIGDNPLVHNAGDTYTDEGASVSDNVDEASDIVITTSGAVNHEVIASYTITYTATDSAGNQSSLTRTVNVADIAPPVITLTGELAVEHNYGDSYSDLGATANDAVDGSVNVTIDIDNLLINKIGSYGVTFTAVDAAGNEATLERIVNVADIKGPVITLNGDSTVILGQGRDYKELGATAVDNVDGEMAVGAPTGTVDYDAIGQYVLTYSVSDAAKNLSTLERTVDVVAPKPFITTWKSDNPGTSHSNQIKITTNPAFAAHYNYNVDWGDGETSENVTGDITHTFTTESADKTYTVTISGDFPQPYNDGPGSDGPKLLTVEQWGDGALLSLNRAFAHNTNFEGNANDTPNLRFVTDMSEMFSNATSFNQDIKSWDVSSVVNMSNMFDGADSFNQNIGAWDVSSVSNMNSMFFSARSFDQDLSAWDVSSANDLEAVFSVSAMSTLNFDSILQSWSLLDLQSNVQLGMSDNGYSANSQAARTILTDTYGWNISNGR